MFNPKRKWLPAMGVTATVSLAVLGAYGLLSNESAVAGISNTKHNLSTGSSQTNHVTAGTAEICVFCHTPHGASSDAGGPPLWNKKLPTIDGTYTTYTSSTLDAASNTTNAPSLACLSCHDGSQAMDNIINAPGSGGYDTTGGGSAGLAWTWTGAQADGRLNAGITNLTKDLSDDHPIMIQYCGGGLTGSGSSLTGSCVDGDFKTPKAATIGGSQAFWVETGTTDNTRTRTDIILYTRSGADSGKPFVECASCHDPHVESNAAGPNGQNSGATFLRISNTGSAVCLACHVK